MNRFSIEKVHNAKQTPSGLFETFMELQAEFVESLESTNNDANTIYKLSYGAIEPGSKIMLSKCHDLHLASSCKGLLLRYRFFVQPALTFSGKHQRQR